MIQDELLQNRKIKVTHNNCFSKKNHVLTDALAFSRFLKDILKLRENRRSFDVALWLCRPYSISSKWNIMKAASRKNFIRRLRPFYFAESVHAPRHACLTRCTHGEWVVRKFLFLYDSICAPNMDASWPGKRTKNRIAAFDKEIKRWEKKMEKQIFIFCILSRAPLSA